MKETRFKDTEIGQIPEDWEEYHLRDLISVLTDFTANGSFSALAENVPYFNTPQYARLVRLTDIRSNFKNSDAIYVTKKSYDYLAKSKLYGGELLLANVGAYAGLACLFPCGMDFVATLAPNMFLIKVDNKAEIKYILNSCNYGVLRNQLFAKASSSAQPKLNKEDVRTCLIPLPTKEEQKRIVSALTIVDNLISSLDKLIEKKKNIKQGTMQQLLTGEKRLKGFSDPWNEIELGELLQYEQPTKYIVSSTEYSDNGTPVLTAGKTFILGYTKEVYGIYSNLPVIIFDDFITDSKFVDFPFKVKSSAMKLLTLRNIDSNLRFVYEIMQMIEFSMTDHKRWWISEYSHILVKVPSLAEQNAIASVLTSMDDEISSLETKKAKFEQIKQGMMQQLLTGKIRLI